MQADVFANQLRGKEVSFQKLAGHKNQDHLQDWHQRIELGKGNADAEQETDNAADIGNERNQTGDETDQQTEGKSDEIQAERVVGAQNDTDAELSANETRQCAVYLAGLFANRGLGLARQQTVDFGDEHVPVAQHVERDDRRNQQQRNQVKNGKAAGYDAAQNAAGKFERISQIVAHVFADFFRFHVWEAFMQPVDERFDFAQERADVLRHDIDKTAQLFIDDADEQSHCRQNDYGDQKQYQEGG